MSDDCDHDFGTVRVSDLRLDDGTGLTTESGLPKQLAGEVTCPQCGDTVTVDYNIAFVDGDRV